MKTGSISLSPQLKYIIFHIFIRFYYFYIIFHIFFWLLCVSGELDLQGKSSKKPQGQDPEERQLLTEDVLRFIAMKYLEGTQPRSKADDLDGFLEYMRAVRSAIVTDVTTGSVIITVECTSLEILDTLWEDCATGHMNEVAQKFLITVDIIREFGEVKVTVTIDEEEYKACRAYFMQFSGKARLCCNAQKESKLYLLG